VHVAQAVSGRAARWLAGWTPPSRPAPHAGCRRPARADAHAAGETGPRQPLEFAGDGRALWLEPEHGQSKLAGLRPAATSDGRLQALEGPFVEKVRDIVGLYLDPPDRALVLCADEKAQIQALDRTQTLLPPR